MSTLRKPRDSDRAVAPVVALLLAVSIMIMAAAQQQMLVVPQEEMAVETQHHRQVMGQLGDLRSDIQTTASTGQFKSQPIQLGTEYEFRLIFGIIPAVHPTNPTGELDSVHPGQQVVIRNATNEKGARNYWNGVGAPCDDTPQCYNTSFVEYTPQYNHYQEAPTTVYENTVMYDKHLNPDGSYNYIVRSQQNLVSGRSINLVTVTGHLDTSGIAPVTVEAHPVSAPAETITLTNNNTSRNLTVQIPTQLPESKWEKLLRDQMRTDPITGDANPNGYITSLDVTSGVLTLKFAKGETYNLKLSRVHLQTRRDASKVPSTKPAYLAWRGSDKITVREGARHTISGQVRDRYNNGVSGVLVNATANYTSGSQECAGSFDSATETCTNGNQPGQLLSDEEGNVQFVYQAPDDVESDRSITINLAIASGEPTISGSFLAPTEQQLTNELLANRGPSKTSNPVSFGLPGTDGTEPRVDTNSGLVNGDETLRIIDFRFRRSVVPKDEEAVATLVFQNTGKSNRSGLSLTPGGPDADAFTATPTSIDNVFIKHGDRQRYAFKFRFNETGVQTVNVHGATARVRVVPANSTSIQGMIENRGTDQNISKDASRFKDGDENQNEYLETHSIPPVSTTGGVTESTASGNLYDLFGTTTDTSDTYASIRRADINLGIATFRVPDNQHFTLHLRYRYLNTNMSHVNVTPVYADGSEVDPNTTYQLGQNGSNMTDVFFALSNDEARQIREQNELLLVYNESTPANEDVKLDIAYHQLVSAHEIFELSHPRVRTSSVAATPSSPTVGEPVTIDALVENHGKSYTFKKVILRQESATRDPHGIRSKKVLLNPGDVKTVTYTHYFYQPGEYTLSVGNQTTTITVTK